TRAWDGAGRLRMLGRQREHPSGSGGAEHGFRRRRNRRARCRFARPSRVLLVTARTRRASIRSRGAAPRRDAMAGVRVLVGTRKGAFVLTADGRRQRWELSGPHFAGWEVYHVKGSPLEPDRIWASQSSSWFGQVIQRSDDGGRSWEPVGNVFQDASVAGTHQWHDGTPHPWEFARVWHFEPSRFDPDTVYAGVEDAALFRTCDGGKSWHELPGL